MPRLSNALRVRAYNISPLLPLVLRETRDLSSAINELRWLREYVNETNKTSFTFKEKSSKLLHLCQRRGRGEPLQYILGTQPFGDLEIRCRPGVLIPRPETEAYTTHLAELLSAQCYTFKRSLRVIDFCSGTGCISLLLHALLGKIYAHMKTTGLDISPKALQLSEENLQMNAGRGLIENNTRKTVNFEYADILGPDQPILDVCQRECDVIISNPPYISERGFNTETARSVRNFEPRLALVPEMSRLDDKSMKHGEKSSGHQFVPEDVFYGRLLHFHKALKSKVLLMEIGDASQARRVVQMAAEIPDRVEIWRDWPDQQESGNMGERYIVVGNRTVEVKGSGKIRAVVLFS